MELERVKSRGTSGNTWAVVCFLVFGLMPAYWKQLSNIPPRELVAYRIIFSFIFTMSLLGFQGKINKIKDILSTREKRKYIILSSISIGLNWLFFVIAIGRGKVLEVTMAYYINPLIVVLIGVFILKEKLNRYEIISVLLAAIGVLTITYRYGKAPIGAIIIGATFAFYGLFKKYAHVDSIMGLAIEMLLLVPFAIGYILFKEFNGTGFLREIPTHTFVTLLFSGMATVVPLMIFSIATRLVSLSTIGFAQYISPTITLFLSIYIFKEPFTTSHLISFGFIWLGLIIYTISQTMKKQI
ncbi:EamA family transporter RarD [Anaeromicrobium sediminis]|uniref:Protein RarD n=1 Tax=Anaeromicrobium sediminis TaxID=1478221 RepID=A0A267MDA3_9FIRM|nr:EamA family transporter RarD [Anaeromicrobium sediminis]PAB56898.1 protein RarD [Anaeromicrobium sediminis]